MDLSSHIFANVRAYVALNRVKTLPDLAVSILDSKKPNANSIKELQRPRDLTN